MRDRAFIIRLRYIDYMNEETIEIVKLSAKEVFLTLADIVSASASFSRPYKRATDDYFDFRNNHSRKDFLQKVHYLQQQGYLKKFIKNKESYIEITDIGKEKLKDLAYNKIKPERQNTWDGKWRVVIFDVPEDKKDLRNYFRRKIKSWGFKQIQKSVYTFPFECAKEITQISYHIGVMKYATVMIAEIIQGEEEILEHFLNNGILLEEDLIVKAK